MRELKMVGIFALVFIVSMYASLWFSGLMPGGNEDTKIIWGALLILTSTIAVCTYLVLNKLGKGSS